MNKSLLYIQFSNVMYTRHSPADTYYDTFYEKYRWLGYWKGEDYFEVPKWIAEVDYLVPDWDTELYVSKSLAETVDFVNAGSWDYILMSLMDCNAEFIEDVIGNASPFQMFILGGYNDRLLKNLAFKYPNVRLANSIRDEARIFGVQYKYGTDYRLFKNFKCIPRLTMSDGCLNRCAFCIIPHGKVTSRNPQEIKRQIDSFTDLKYKLVYIDDKTFGQADNWKTLGEWYRYIKNVNEEFEGFIVQTTAGELKNKADLFAQNHVVVAEIGVETYNNHILKKYRKPATVSLIKKAIKAACSSNVYVIANIMCGFAEETPLSYYNTAAFLGEYVYPTPEDYIIGINPAIYTDYTLEDSGGEIEFKNDPNQLHQTAFNALCDIATTSVRRVDYAYGANSKEPQRQLVPSSIYLYKYRHRPTVNSGIPSASIYLKNQYDTRFRLAYEHLILQSSGSSDGCLNNAYSSSPGTLFDLLRHKESSCLNRISSDHNGYIIPEKFIHSMNFDSTTNTTQLLTRIRNYIQTAPGLSDGWEKYDTFYLRTKRTPEENTPENIEKNISNTENIS